MEQLSLREHRGNGVVVLAVSGELDMLTGPQLGRHLAALAAAGHHRVILDAANLAFCDAAGITILIKAHARAGEQQGWLRLLHARHHLRRLLAIVALTEVLPVFDTVEDATYGALPAAANCIRAVAADQLLDVGPVDPSHAS
jgi:anti-sigma B factor antagonist